jgi:hypothetical protein
MKRAFCRWRLAVWTKRVDSYRSEFNRARTSQDVNAWEQLLTLAIYQQTKWRKRVRA